jgi:DNA-binding IclR family transcriptional regulator
VGARAGKLVVLDKVEGTGLLRAAPSVGTEVPVETTASGRLYLGIEPDALRDAAQRAGKAARRAMELAVERGYDLNRGEWIAGLSVVAAPVCATGRMHGTIACAAAEAQLDEARLAEAIRRTRAVADRVSRALDGRKTETRAVARESEEAP